MKVVTRWNRLGRITSHVDPEIQNNLAEMSQIVLETQDKGIRQALIDLGWTPPEEKMQLPPGIAPDLENGLKCSWMGKKTPEMTRDELITFIGMLDTWATYLWKKLHGEKKAVIMRSCHNCCHEDHGTCLIAFESASKGIFVNAILDCGSKFKNWAHDGSGKR